MREYEFKRSYRFLVWPLLGVFGLAEGLITQRIPAGIGVFGFLGSLWISWTALSDMRFRKLIINDNDLTLISHGGQQVTVSEITSAVQHGPAKFGHGVQFKAKTADGRAKHFILGGRPIGLTWPDLWEALELWRVGKLTPEEHKEERQKSERINRILDLLPGIVIGLFLLGYFLLFLGR